MNQLKDVMEISQAELATIMKDLDFLSDAIDRSESLAGRELILARFIVPGIFNNHFHVLNIFPLTQFVNPIQRMVINQDVAKVNERLKNLSQIRYPPIDIESRLNYNRASLKGKSVFYAGAGMLQIHTEAKPKIGQLTTTSKWTIKDGKTLNTLIISQNESIVMKNPIELFDEYQRYLNFVNELPTNVRSFVIRLNDLIAKAFSKKVDSHIPQGYLISAAIANYFLFGTRYEVDAVYYPSYQMGGCCMNYAIKPQSVDEKLDFVEAHENYVEVDPSLGTKGFGSLVTGICKGFDTKTLGLIWENYP